jgi:hypothetical protein
VEAALAIQSPLLFGIVKSYDIEFAGIECAGIIIMGQTDHLSAVLQTNCRFEAGTWQGITPPDIIPGCIAPADIMPVCIMPVGTMPMGNTPVGIIVVGTKPAEFTPEGAMSVVMPTQGTATKQGALDDTGGAGEARTKSSERWSAGKTYRVELSNSVDAHVAPMAVTAAAAPLSGRTKALRSGCKWRSNLCMLNARWIATLSNNKT